MSFTCSIGSPENRGYYSRISHIVISALKPMATRHFQRYDISSYFHFKTFDKFNVLRSIVRLRTRVMRNRGESRNRPWSSMTCLDRVKY